jgi:hypothetical protein
MNKQTAVEWLFNQMSNVAAGYVTEMNIGEIFTHAKQMEKEQIIDMLVDNDEFYGMHVRKKSEEFVNEYFNQTFGSNNE